MTRWKIRWDTVQNVLEWALIALMFGAALYLIFYTPTPPAGATGPVASLFGQASAVIIYATVWLVEACLLALAKWYKWMRVRKWTLFAIYLTHQFTFFLAWNLRGFGPNLIDNFVISVLAAWLWLRAKLNNEYVAWEDLEHFDEQE